MTRIASTKEGRALFLAVHKNWGGIGQDWTVGRAAEAELVAMIERDLPRYDLCRVGSMIDWCGWQDGWGVPSCGMVKPGPAVNIEVAEARGLTWSMECAKRLGFYEWPPDAPPALARVGWKGSRKAYMHAIDCETCLLEGIAKCEVFPRIAYQEIESDLDPRLDPEHVG